jgi:predicted RNase H-like HicB family nuclease
MVNLPWTWRGPNRVEEDGNIHWEITIDELPDFFVAAESHAAVLNELPAALKAFLQTYIDRDEIPPMPQQIDRWRVVKVWTPAMSAPSTTVEPATLGVSRELVTAG